MRVLSIVCLLLLSISLTRAEEQLLPDPRDEDIAVAGETYSDFVEPLMKLVVLFGKNYNFYMDVCGSKSLGYKQVIETWKDRHEDLAQNIRIAKYFAYKKMVERIGEQEASNVSAAVDKKVKMAGNNAGAILHQEKNNGTTDCTTDIKKISKGYFDIEALQPGTTLRVTAYIDQQKLFQPDKPPAPAKWWWESE
ncbi:MAG: hypothetical protein V4568_17780 [Pseudomonadota bacterium]